MKTMLFSEVFGHGKVKAALQNAAGCGRVGHAYIFEGPKGVGKLSMAKAFAMRLLCESPMAEDACGECRACSQCMSGNHPDLQIVTNQLYDASKKSSDILVDTVRNMKKDIYIKPYSSDRKVYIVPNADTMNVYAQNSLLKVLEEPPEYCVIILLAENSNAFLPTILSRAPILKFYPLSADEVCECLAKCDGDFDADKITAISRMCGGCIGRAKELLQNEEADALRCSLIDAVCALWGTGRRSIYDLCLLLKQNRDEFELLKGVMESLFVDLLYVNSTGRLDNITNIDKSIKIKNLAEHIGEKCPVWLNGILFKYSDYLNRNISYAQVAQALSLELWEAINDRGYRNKI